MKIYNTLREMAEAYEYPYNMFKHYMRMYKIKVPLIDKKYHVTRDFDIAIKDALYNSGIRKRGHSYINMHARTKFENTLRKMFHGDNRSGDERAKWYVETLEKKVKENYNI